MCWHAMRNNQVYRKSTKALLGWSGGSFSHQHLNPNIGFVTLNVMASSWDTSQDTLVWKVSTSGSCGSSAFHYNSRYQGGWKVTPLTLTATEIVSSGLSKTPVLQLKSSVRNGFGAHGYMYMRGVVCIDWVPHSCMVHRARNKRLPACLQVPWLEVHRAWAAVAASALCLR